MNIKPSVKSTDQAKIERMEKAYQHFSAMIKCDRMIATGSFALCKLGLATKASDLDIRVINISEESLEALKKLQEQDESKHLIIEYKGVKKFDIIRIIYDGFKIDFFVAKNAIGPEDYITLSNGMNISGIKSIIAAKKACNRLKDWMQLLSIARMFIKKNEFIGFLNAQTDSYIEVDDFPDFTL